MQEYGGRQREKCKETPWPLLHKSTALSLHLGFPHGSDSKESACNAEDLGSILGLRRSPGGGHGNPLQYSCLGNPHGQKRLVGYSPWVCRVRHNWAIKHRDPWQRKTTLEGVKQSRKILFKTNAIWIRGCIQCPLTKVRRVFKCWGELVEKYWRTLGWGGQ